MKGFKFRLQSLLNVKEKFEQQAKIVFGEETAKLEAEKSKLVDLYNNKEDVLQKQRESFTGTINIHSFNEYRNYSMKLDKMIIEQIEAVQKQHIKTEEAKKKLADIMKERKTLEKLKEKEVEIFKKEMQLAEDKQVDELVTYKFGTR